MEPRIIETKADDEAAWAHVATLMDAEIGTVQEQEPELFALLVEQYEHEHFPFEDRYGILLHVCSRQQMKLAPNHHGH
jgi:antitoxin component HigA of HigAB toxin-antitoxin module